MVKPLTDRFAWPDLIAESPSDTESSPVSCFLCLSIIDSHARDGQPPNPLTALFSPIVLSMPTEQELFCRPLSRRFKARIFFSYNVLESLFFDVREEEEESFFIASNH